MRIMYEGPEQLEANTRPGFVWGEGRWRPANPKSHARTEGTPTLSYVGGGGLPDVSDLRWGPGRLNVAE
jgi:hypothetical protein